MAMMPSRGAGRRRAPMAEINVTPLVDVMLVLLIIFMVTAPLLTAGVPVNLPDSRAKPLEQDQKPVEISIDASGELFVDKQAIAKDQLAGALDRLAGRSEQPTVFLRADKAVGWDRVASVMGEINRAGLGKLSIVTEASAK